MARWLSTGGESRECPQDGMARGEHLNVTEDRAVMHMALRAAEDEVRRVWNCERRLLCLLRRKLMIRHSVPSSRHSGIHGRRRERGARGAFGPVPDRAFQRERSVLRMEGAMTLPQDLFREKEANAPRACSISCCFAFAFGRA